MKNSIIKRSIRALVIASSAMLLCIATFYVFFVRPWDSGVVASIALPNGSEVMVTQTYNHEWSEPYSVRVWQRDVGGSWRGGYVDHESGSWRNCSMVFDNLSSCVIVYKGGVERIRLRLSDGAFDLDNGSIRRRDTLSANNWGKPPFPFPEA